MTHLKVPYLSQRDNVHNPGGSCNVTSVAMVLSYFGFKGTGEGQFEDQLYTFLEDTGRSRHDPQDLKWLIETYSRRAKRPLIDDFRPNHTFQAVQRHLDAGYPAIAHGYFTRFGHILVVVGYDAKGFFVHDPWGAWGPAGYDHDKTGKDDYFLYGTFTRLVEDYPGSGGWFHLVRPAQPPVAKAA